MDLSASIPYNLGAQLERPHGQLDFDNMQVMSGFGVFNKYLAETAKDFNYDIRRQIT